MIDYENEKMTEEEIERARASLPDGKTPVPYPELTPRELEVAVALACGLTCRDIATQLNISVKTVDTHRGHVLKKLACENAVFLARKLIRDGVVRP